MTSQNFCERGLFSLQSSVHIQCHLEGMTFDGLLRAISETSTKMTRSVHPSIGQLWTCGGGNTGNQRKERIVRGSQRGLKSGQRARFPQRVLGRYLGKYDVALFILSSTTKGVGTLRPLLSLSSICGADIQVIPPLIHRTLIQNPISSSVTVRWTFCRIGRGFGR